MRLYVDTSAAFAAVKSICIPCPDLAASSHWFLARAQIRRMTYRSPSKILPRLKTQHGSRKNSLAKLEHPTTQTVSGGFVRKKEAGRIAPDLSTTPPPVRDGRASLHGKSENSLHKSWRKFKNCNGASRRQTVENSRFLQSLGWTVHESRKILLGREVTSQLGQREQVPELK